MIAEELQGQWQKKLALLSGVRSPLPHSIPWAKLGLIPTEIDEYLENLVLLFIIVDRAQRKPFTVKSDFAREGALHVAIAASEGLISTQIEEDSWGKRWLATPIGQEVIDDVTIVLKEILQPSHTTH